MVLVLCVDLIVVGVGRWICGVGIVRLIVGFVGGRVVGVGWVWLLVVLVVCVRVCCVGRCLCCCGRIVRLVLLVRVLDLLCEICLKD